MAIAKGTITSNKEPNPLNSVKANEDTNPVVVPTLKLVVEIPPKSIRSIDLR